MTQYARKSVRQFARDMERKLRDNDHKGGWEYMTLRQLLRRAEQELGELRRAITGGRKQPHECIDEAADVANFCMMIADNLRKP